MISQIFMLLHFVIDVLGFTLSSYLTYIAIKKSPPYLKTYSILIINIAVFGMIISLMDAAAMTRTISHKASLVYVSHALCSYVGSLTCFICHNIMLHLYTHYFWAVLLCYIFRYYTLTRGAFSRNILIWLIMLAYSFSLTQLILFQLTPELDEQLLPVIREKYPEEDFPIGLGNAYYGCYDLSTWNNNLATLHVLYPRIPIAIVEFILSIRMHMYLKENEAFMSQNTKNIHTQLIKALCYQATLPVVFFTTLIMFLIPRSLKPDAVWIGYAHYTVSAMTPMMSAIFNLYFIKSYWNVIKKHYRLILGKDQVIQITGSLEGNNTTSSR